MVGRAARRRVDEVPFVDRDDRYGTGARLQSVFDGRVLDQAIDHTDTKLLVITEDSRSESDECLRKSPVPVHGSGELPSSSGPFNRQPSRRQRSSSRLSSERQPTGR
jgi:hypothetical protein